MAKLTLRIWILIILLITAAVFIVNPQAFSKGVVIKEITPNSSAYLAGIKTGEIIKSINEQPISNVEDYSKIASSIKIDEAGIIIETANRTFIYNSSTLDFELANNKTVLVYGNALKSGLTEGLEIQKINGFSLDNYTFDEIKANIEPKAKITIKTDKNNYIFLTNKNLGIIVSDIQKTRIKTGLDLQGGSRALVKPERELNKQEMANLLETVRYRLNVYGLTDINIRDARDLQGNSYMVVELAGSTPSELKDLIAKQGKFEAKISNETVFVGGANDITFVCRNDASCAYVQKCDESNGAICKFLFEVHLSEQAAKRHANITSNLAENTTTPGYLNETLRLYLDDKFVDELLIDVDLKGQTATRIAISGSGTGSTKQEAYENALINMKKLQTILITGSLPFKLEIVKLDSISPTLGKEFTRNVIIALIAAFIGVCLVIYIRYRHLSLFIPVTITIISETLLTLFVAALIKWNIDMAGIAGIIAAVGTGVDDQVVMIDESKTGKHYSLKERIKRAFFIIFGAYATVVVSLLPLWWVGAGLLRGFAVTTLIGITIGVFITRPAFADILKKITKE